MECVWEVFHLSKEPLSAKVGHVYHYLLIQSDDTVSPYLKEVFVVCRYDKRVMNENEELFKFTWQCISFDD